MLIQGDCVVEMAKLPAESIDSVVCDPPYGLEFMGKEWDRLGATTLVDPGEVGGFQDGNGGNAFSRSRVRYGASAASMQAWHQAWATEALRVLKPGGYLLAFGGTRTFHRLTCAIEDAGFEIRDCLSWMYGSGFPKSKNLDGDRQGWGTALKPAWEPIIMARKPLIGTVAANVLKFGTGAINVDGSRIGTEVLPELRAGQARLGTFERTNMVTPARVGRWPANVVLDEEAAALLDEQSGERASGSRAVGVRGGLGYHGATGDGGPAIEGSTGSASRFFFTAKASSAERSEGMATRSTHPTVKPVALMSWLVRMVTPPGGTVLDPFLGSGSTAVAAAGCGFDWIGIERDPEYVAIAEQRLGLFGLTA